MENEFDNADINVENGIDIRYMQRALELAKLGEGKVNPNPCVGAVIVKNGKVIGEGYHQQYGGLHAERNALASCIEYPEGAEMYVTLEPCCHYGKTPPCTEAIIENKIAKVIVGSNDPNPVVAGGGIEQLRKNGIQVVENVLRDECDKLNEAFFYYIKNKRPFVAMKYAMTMDGKIATHTGASRWITGEAAREHVHMLRNKYAGIMVGVQTVIMDNPMLDCRIDGGRNPIRIICDSSLRIPFDSRIVQSAKEIPTIIAMISSEVNNNQLQSKKSILEQIGCTVIDVESKGNRVDLDDLMQKLGAMEIDSILLEGGSELNYSALAEHIVNKSYVYIAPKMFGGNAKTPVGGIGVDVPDMAFKVRDSKVKMLGEDIIIESYFWI